MQVREEVGLIDGVSATNDAGVLSSPLFEAGSDLFILNCPL